MIYSRFGTRLTLLSRQQANDRLSIQATAGGTPEIRHYYMSDLTADGGTAEIEAAIAGLPWRIVPKKAAQL